MSLYMSLAKQQKQMAKELQDVTGKKFDIVLPSKRART